MALKMRQSLAQLEDEFWYETELEERRQAQLRREAAQRSRKRTYQRLEKRRSLRFWGLILALILTAVIVTVGMFVSLYYLLA
jgi:ABC-type Fe3+ transport system permease subunit